MARLGVQALRRMRGGAQSQLMLCDDGQLWVVKFKNNPQDVRVLANELIATRLAKAIGLTVPDSDVVEVTEWLVANSMEMVVDLGRGRRERCATGLQFGSLYVGGLMPGQVMDYLPEPQLLEVRNVKEFAGVLCLDKWTGNSNGRQAVFSRKQRERKYLATFIDQGFCFNAGDWSFPDSPLRGVYAQDAVYRGVTGWESFEPWLSKLEELDVLEFEKIVAVVPPEWYGGDLRAIEGLMERLMERRGRVRELIGSFRDSNRKPFPMWVPGKRVTVPEGNQRWEEGAHLGGGEDLAMAERKPHEFFLIRYAPDPAKNEAVNIGVILREAEPGAGTGTEPSMEATGGSGPGARKTAVRFTRNWTRVRCMQADADIEVLEALEGDIRGRLELLVEAGAKGVVEGFLDSWSNAVQIENSRAYLADSLAAGLTELMKVHVEAPRTPGSREKERTGRPAITAAMRLAFEQKRVWEQMRKRIAVAPYTRKGDPFRIDCGYRPNGIIRMFHGVSLDADVEQAKILSFAAPELRTGVRRVDGADLELTAVVEALRTVSESEDEAGERYRFGVDVMEREGIRVITVNDLARAAETARRELGI